MMVRTIQRAPADRGFRFIDLFCGIGGFHQAALDLGGKCVFACDTDADARRSYEENYGISPESDIRSIKARSIPAYDLLFAGFPCQPFSIIGKRKGMDDERGTLVFEVLRILKTTKPSMVLLENVKQLSTHDGGRTLNKIVGQLEKLGYGCCVMVLNALDYGLPQKRERTLIACFKNHKHAERFVPPQKKHIGSLRKILEKKVDSKYYASERILKKRRKAHTSQHAVSIWHENKGGNISSYPYSCALRASASYNYLLVNGERRLTEREMLRLQGFPDNFKIVGGYTQVRHQAGNAVPVPMVREMIRSMLNVPS